MTLAAAVIGTWIGARVALDRFRRERAFDRRMDWHDRALRAARRSFQAAADAEHAIRQGADDKPFADQRAAAGRELGAVLNESRMYATDIEFKIVAAISQAIGDHQARLNEIHGEVDRAVMAQLLDVETSLLNTLQQVIAGYGKRLLLGEGWWTFRYRKVRRELTELRARARQSIDQSAVAQPSDSSQPDA